MSFINTQITIDGTTAELTRIDDASANIQLAEHNYRAGETCVCTVFMNLIGRMVPLKLKAKIIAPQPGGITITFKAPTPNWGRLIKFLNNRNAAL